MENEPALYGIKKSNRKPDEYWSKNKFNSSFPVALANYMRDKNIKAQYIYLDGGLRPRISEIDIGEVYNASRLTNENLYFGFEQRYDPYQKYSYEQIPNIDLIIKSDKGFLRPLEVKLTVIPDNTTKDNNPIDWGSEIVIRPPTTTYCALGMIDSCSDSMDAVREIFEPECRKIDSWSNAYEISANMPKLIDIINRFERKFYERQQPLLLQPIWRTDGQSPILSENAFDLFVWSDYAFTRLFLDRSSNGKIGAVSRQMRSTARLARCIYEISKSGKVRIDEVYRQMAFNYQTDKEFSVSGAVTNNYMRCPRLEKPIVSRNALFEIIQNGGEKLLMPERRFDQTIYFTMTK